MCESNIHLHQSTSVHPSSAARLFPGFYLGLSDGHEEASYLFEYRNGKSAGAQLAGAEQNKSQSFHSMQHSGVRTSV